MDNQPNRHCARRPSSRPLLAEEGPLFQAPLPRRRRGGAGATRIGGNRMNPNPLLGRGKRLCRRGGEWPRCRPVPPFELVAVESTASEIGRSFPRLSTWRRAAWSGADLPRPPHRPTEIAGTTRQLAGPLRVDRVDKADFPPLLYAPRRRGIGFLEMVREIGDSAPHLVAGEMIDGDLGRPARWRVAVVPAVRKSRLARRQFTVPAFRTLIAD